MGRSLELDLEQLKERLLVIGSLVEEATNKATLVLVNRRPELAHEVIEGDAEIDTKEVGLEEERLRRGLSLPVRRLVQLSSLLAKSLVLANVECFGTTQFPTGNIPSEVPLDLTVPRCDFATGSMEHRVE